MSRFVESIARTNKLKCSSCNEPILKGDDVIFKLDNRGKFEDVYGERCKCKKSYVWDAIEDNEHPFSSDALGQD
jgi:hypothetical protein